MLQHFCPNVIRFTYSGHEYAADGPIIAILQSNNYHEKYTLHRSGFASHRMGHWFSRLPRRWNYSYTIGNSGYFADPGSYTPGLSGSCDDPILIGGLNPPQHIP